MAHTRDETALIEEHIALLDEVRLERDHHKQHAADLGEALSNCQDINADLLEALEATDAQINEIGRYSDPPDAYAEIPWECVDQIRAAIAKARKE